MTLNNVISDRGKPDDLARSQIHILTLLSTQSRCKTIEGNFRHVLVDQLLLEYDVKMSLRFLAEESL